MTSTNPATNPILRDPAEQAVSPLELLFDLVFVLGVAELTRHLVARLTWRGAAETLVLYVPVFAVWFYTSWAATLYSLSHPRARRMILAVMVVGLFLNASLTRAFADAAGVFVASLLVIQIGRTAWMLTTHLDPINHDQTVVTPGTALASAPIRASSVLSGTLAIGGTLCLWWLYFRAEPIALRHVSEADDRVYASRTAANGLLVLIAGLIALAAGNALIIDHPTRDATLALALLLFSGPALFLLTQAWYLHLVFGTTPRSLLVAIAALAAVTGAALPAPAVVSGVGVVVVLSTLVAVEHLKSSDQSQSDTSATSA